MSMMCTGCQPSSRLSYRLGGLLGRGGTENQVGAGILDLDNLQNDGRLGQLVLGLRDHHLLRLGAEARLMPLR